MKTITIEPDRHATNAQGIVKKWVASGSVRTNGKPAVDVERLVEMIAEALHDEELRGRETT